jgi:hypothetical protein
MDISSLLNPDTSGDSGPGGNNTGSGDNNSGPGGNNSGPEGNDSGPGGNDHGPGSNDSGSGNNDHGSGNNITEANNSGESMRDRVARKFRIQYEFNKDVSRNNRPDVYSYEGAGKLDRNEIAYIHRNADYNCK